MFDGAEVTFGAEPNTQVTPVSLGLPGALPAVNATAVEYAIRIGLALNCSIAETCRFARKNYFYPDVPKNFQTSQYDEPIAYEGWVDVELDDGSIFRVEIERAHMEEDAGKNTHIGGSDGRIHGAEYSLVDYNRAGIPLVEIVTKPITGAGARAPEVARAYVQTLRDIFRALGRLRGEDGARQRPRRRQRVDPPDARSRRWAPAPRPRTSTRSGRSSGPCATRSAARRACSTTASRSSRRRATGTRTPAPRRPAA